MDVFSFLLFFWLLVLFLLFLLLLLRFSSGSSCGCSCKSHWGWSCVSCSFFRPIWPRKTALLQYSSLIVLVSDVVVFPVLVFYLFLRVDYVAVLLSALLICVFVLLILLPVSSCLSFRPYYCFRSSCCCCCCRCCSCCSRCRCRFCCLVDVFFCSCFWFLCSGCVVAVVDTVISGVLLILC